MAKRLSEQYAPGDVVEILFEQAGLRATHSARWLGSSIRAYGCGCRTAVCGLLPTQSESSPAHSQNRTRSNLWCRSAQLRPSRGRFLRSTPRTLDFFAIPSPDFEDQIFVINDMTIMAKIDRRQACHHLSRQRRMGAR